MFKAALQRIIRYPENFHLSSNSVLPNQASEPQKIPVVRPHSLYPLSESAHQIWLKVHVLLQNQNNFQARAYKDNLLLLVALLDKNWSKTNYRMKIVLDKDWAERIFCAINSVTLRWLRIERCLQSFPNRMMCWKCETSFISKL